MKPAKLAQDQQRPNALDVMKCINEISLMGNVSALLNIITRMLNNARVIIGTYQ
jgi:hypothetical protein